MTKKSSAPVDIAKQHAKRRLRLGVFRGFAILAFVVMFACVPLAEKLGIEKAFAAAIVASLALALLFASARRRT